KAKNFSARTGHPPFSSHPTRSCILRKVRRQERAGSLALCRARFARKGSRSFGGGLPAFARRGIVDPTLCCRARALFARVFEIAAGSALTGYLTGKELAAAYASADIF